MSSKNKKKHLFMLFANIAKVIAPPPDLTVCDWADEYRRLSSESSAEPGQWRTDRAPYQREPMEAITDPKVKKVILPWGAQMGKSELLNNVIGYHIDQDPCPVMMIQPTVDLAKAYSKERLAPMFRDTPVLDKKVADAKSRDSGNTILQKSFPGGHLAMVGANSPSGLASRPIRILLADEIDRFPVSAGTEGDPVALAEKRTTTFWNKKMIYASTPTIKDASPIEKQSKLGTQEHYELPCPRCGEYQFLKWGQLDIETKELHCSCCGYGFTETQWKKQLHAGKWVPYNEETDRSIRSFRINALYSPWVSWNELIKEYLEALDDMEKMKSFVNTRLAECFELDGYSVSGDSLVERKEAYDCEVPDGVLVLTSGVDVQDNRLEYEVIGWGEGYESWGIHYGVIMGDPGQDFVWKQLDDVLLKKYTRKDGVQLTIMTTCVDSGGHHTKKVYEYCRTRESHRVWAIKGQGGSGHPYIKIPKKRNDAGVFLFLIGTDVGKDTVVSRLQAQEGHKGYCHFPSEEEKGYTNKYFDGLTAEHRVVRVVNGQNVTRWEKKTSGARNEPFDIRNYASAAIEILNPRFERIRDSLSNTKPQKNDSRTEKIDQETAKSVSNPRKRRVVKREII